MFSRTRVFGLNTLLAACLVFAPAAFAQENAADSRPIEKTEAGEEHKDKRKDLSFEERNERAEKRYNKLKAKLDSLPPEKRAKAEEKLKQMEGGMKEREAIRKELARLPREEREARMRQIVEEFEKERTQKMQERQGKIQESYMKMTPAEQAAFCEKAHARCQIRGRESGACGIVGSICRVN